jgi:hypothetical protein
MDRVVISSSLRALLHLLVLSANGSMLFVEIFPDSNPAVDSLCNVMRSVIRTPAGALLSAGVFGADNATRDEPMRIPSRHQNSSQLSLSLLTLGVMKLDALFGGALGTARNATCGAGLTTIAPAPVCAIG